MGSLSSSRSTFSSFGPCSLRLTLHLRPRFHRLHSLRRACHPRIPRRRSHLLPVCLHPDIRLLHLRLSSLLDHSEGEIKNAQGRQVCLLENSRRACYRSCTSRTAVDSVELCAV